MIYVPGRFLFVHIPRTAGTSLTFKLMQHLKNNVRFDTTPLWKHATAANLKLVIPDFHTIKKFAIDRDIEEIIRSDYKLHRTVIPKTLAAEFIDSWNQSRNETLEEFRERRWKPWVGNRSAWEHWVGNEPFARYHLNDLKSHMPEIMQTCGLPEDTELEFLST
jgi:hypothetical protein